jgi:N-acetylmuramoyl-L-alanine amidase
MLALPMIAQPVGYSDTVQSARAQAAPPSAHARPAAAALAPNSSHIAEGMPEQNTRSDLIGDHARLPDDFRKLAKSAGEPQIPGLAIVYLHPLGDPADARGWRNIIVHQTEGPAGSAKNLALAQAKNPGKRGVMLWVEIDGTVYWSTAETAIPTHGDGANRNDNKYIDNSKTYRSVIKTNSIGVEFVGNYPDVGKPATPEQIRAWLLLVRFLQERYEIPAERIYAHNWIDYKDHRYCEGCDLAALARKLAHEPGKTARR